jgi:hypothetical protein
MRIGKEQLHILGRHVVMNQLMDHARKVAPGVCEKMSVDHLESVAHHCMKRCEHYGITRDYDILRYLNLMLVFGVTFDREQPWAEAPLSFRNPAARMELLMDHALLQIPDGSAAA